MRPMAWFLAAVCSLALVLALGALSRVPYGAGEGAEQGVLRLSWRLRGARVRECRRLSPEELEALPIHMRRPEVCEGRVAPYRLQVTIDGALVEDTLVSAAGARQDRPIYVWREIHLPVGEHRVGITFTTESAPSGPAPARLALDTVIVISPGHYALVTLEPVRRELILISATGSGS